MRQIETDEETEDRGTTAFADCVGLAVCAYRLNIPFWYLPFHPLVLNGRLLSDFATYMSMQHSFRGV